MAARVTGKPTAARRPAPAASANATDTTTTPSPVEDVEPERIVLAVIDGIECTAPAAVPFGLTLRHLDNLVRLKPRYAELFLVKALIGQETFGKLTGSAISPEDWRHLADAASKHLLGPLEKKGASGN